MLGRCVIGLAKKFDLLQKLDELCILIKFPDRVRWRKVSSGIVHAARRWGSVLSRRWLRPSTEFRPLRERSICVFGVLAIETLSLR